jgi:poly(glycerol-phosphate) alpha-glucosyltransferase
MAAGLPVIITPGCNLPEVGHHGAGLVVSTTPSDVTRALEILFRDLDQARAFGKNATALVKARFTWEKIAQQTIEFYRQVIEARSKLAKL